MKKLIYATGNNLKYKLAAPVALQHNVQLTQSSLDIDEIQSQDVEKVARDKAFKAFTVVKQPVFITDDSWSFMGLGGFPGVYMHDVAEWLSADDFLRLTSGLKDRRAILTQTAVYQDATQQKVFSRSHEGVLLEEIKGRYPGHPHFSLITMPEDKGKSMAQVFTSGSSDNITEVWHRLFRWVSGEER
jgi:inosine/xanthosine triphosphate pyrophosphatase family protein